MLKILDGVGRAYGDSGFDARSAVPYIGTATDRFRVKALDLGHGQVEATATRVIAWQEADWSPDYLADVMAAIERAKMERDEEEARQLHRLRAARRAKTRVRRLCKVMGADTLLTLTYRGAQPDLAVMKAHVKAFNRRMLTVLPGFCFVACFELQKRGTWHAHLATRAIPASLPPAAGGGDWRSYNVIRAIWRSVTGELAGNVDISRRKRHSIKSAAEVAGYISKYIAKTFEDESAGRHERYAVYGVTDEDRKRLEPTELGVYDSLHAAIDASYGVLLDAQSVHTARLDHWKDWFFVAGELRPKRKRPERYDA